MSIAAVPTLAHFVDRPSAVPSATFPADASPVAERLHRRTMRRLIGAFAALALAGALASGPAPAPSAGSVTTVGAGAGAVPGPITRMRGGAGAALAVIRRFTASLTAAQFDALAGPTGTGVRLAELTAPQRTAAVEMLRGLLSSDAWAVLSEAMAADDALAAAGAGEGSGGYVVGYLEDPVGQTAFLQFAGPQLAVNVLLRGGEMLVEPELIDGRDLAGIV